MHQYGESDDQHILADAISTGRELIAAVPTDSSYYKMGVSNLLSRLRCRYKATHDPGDYDEIMRLMDELLQRADSDNSLRAYVLFSGATSPTRNSAKTGPSRT